MRTCTRDPCITERGDTLPIIHAVGMKGSVLLLSVVRCTDCTVLCCAVLSSIYFPLATVTTAGVLPQTHANIRGWFSQYCCLKLPSYRYTCSGLLDRRTKQETAERLPKAQPGKMKDWENHSRRADACYAMLFRTLRNGLYVVGVFQNNSANLRGRLLVLSPLRR